MNYLNCVPVIFQNPELPTGCEATAATMLLRAYGYDVDKIDVASRLKQSEFIEKDGIVYSNHPNEYFIGNPTNRTGYGVFAGEIARVMSEIIKEYNGIHHPIGMFGKKEEQILKYIDSKRPVCIWTSMNNLEIQYRRGWYLIQNSKYTDIYFQWPANEHCVVLVGYDCDKVEVIDPIVGKCTYPRKDFFKHYEQVGGYALILK